MKTDGHQSDRMSISPFDAVSILKRTGKFQPGPEINATVVVTEYINLLLLSKLVFPGWSKSFSIFWALYLNEPDSDKL